MKKIKDLLREISEKNQYIERLEDLVENLIRKKGSKCPECGSTNRFWNGHGTVCHDCECEIVGEEL